MLSAGKLNDRVTILEPTTEQGKFGEQVTIWKAGKTVWAFNIGCNACEMGNSDIYYKQMTGWRHFHGI